jgi:centromere-localized protein 2
VRENIAREVKRGERQKEELRTARAATGVAGMDHKDQLEMDMDIQLFGQPSTTAADHRHSLRSLLPEMERACASMEKEIESAEAEAAAILAELTARTGELSDLRYGKFNKPSGIAGDIVDEAIRGLNKLEEACNHAGMN